MTLASPAVVPPILTETGMAPGCYRYTQTGTNAVGGFVAVSTYVRVDTTGPVGGALTVNGVAATTAGSTSTATAAGYPSPHGVDRPGDDDHEHADPRGGDADERSVRRLRHRGAP